MMYRYPRVRHPPSTTSSSQVKSSRGATHSRSEHPDPIFLSFLFFFDRLKHLDFIYSYFKSSTMETIDRIKVDHMRAESVQWKDIATDQKVSYSTLLRWRNSIQYVDPEPLVASN